MKEEAAKYGIKNIADGSNYDNQKDYRPGLQATKELGVLNPLIEANLTKEDIRYLSKKIGLPTWNKPSLAYLRKIEEDRECGSIIKEIRIYTVQG